MQHEAGSFPNRLSVAQQSLGRGCLLTACATQTLPTRGTIQGVKNKKLAPPQKILTQRNRANY